MSAWLSITRFKYKICAAFTYYLVFNNVYLFEFFSFSNISQRLIPCISTRFLGFGYVYQYAPRVLYLVYDKIFHFKCISHVMTGEKH